MQHTQQVQWNNLLVVPDDEDGIDWIQRVKADRQEGEYAFGKVCAGLHQDTLIIVFGTHRGDHKVHLDNALYRNSMGEVHELTWRGGARWSIDDTGDPIIEENGSQTLGGALPPEVVELVLSELRQRLTA